MPRLPYADPKAEETYQQIAAQSSKADAYKKLSGDMAVDNYTGGMLSSAAASQAQSIDEQVRKRR